MALPPDVAWRLVRKPFADLSGTGARLYGGRWNSPGRPMLYLAADAALAVLEVRVHLDLPPDLLPPDYVLARVYFTAVDESNEGGVLLECGPTKPLTLRESREAGDTWLQEQSSLLLKVPSVIVPESANLLMNPMHPLAATLPSISSRPFAFDSRLFE